MSALYIVLPLAVLIVAVAIGAFLWAARRGQFDDLDTPAVRILHDDEPASDEAEREGKKDVPSDPA